MKRAYYTDPLAAAWMAKRHGFKYVNKWRSEPEPEWSKDASQYYNLRQEWMDKKYEVRADSMHLLEPQVGDLLALRIRHPCGAMCNDPYFMLLRCSWDEVDFDEMENVGEFIGDYESHIIVQRDGKPFHWPVFEEAA